MEFKVLCQMCNGEGNDLHGCDGCGGKGFIYKHKKLLKEEDVVVVEVINYRDGVIEHIPYRDYRIAPPEFYCEISRMNTLNSPRRFTYKYSINGTDKIFSFVFNMEEGKFFNEIFRSSLSKYNLKESDVSPISKYIILSLDDKLEDLLGSNNNE